MITPTHFGPAAPLWRAEVWQAWALGRLASLGLMSIDLRVALAAAVARLLIQAGDRVVRHIMGRAWRGARLAEDITAAATMVAAAGR